ncbi:helix-turn-helix domain-containing protein [Mycobacteroides abscessus]|uniref:helix-turn-helix domain-containing protein n=1 Tax=Mycobacteroides abscessus TaxID=36809 RepID=UPI002350D1CC|nr:helix-turn-helix transcriptional regulator [Mycobacteroides abscessus]
MGDAWHRATSERVGKAVASRRKELRMTAQQLADKCAELKVPIHRTTITKIENGRARFDLGELLILAAALELPPMSLLLPNILETVEVLPGKEVGGATALGWFIGAGSQTGSGDARFVPSDVKTDSSMDIPLRLMQIELEWTRAVFDASAGGDEDPDRFLMPEWMREVVREVGAARLSRIQNLEIERDTLVREYIDRHGTDGDGWITSMSIGSHGQIARRYQLPESSSDLYEIRDGHLTRLDDDDPRRKGSSDDSA